MKTTLIRNVFFAFVSLAAIPSLAGVSSDWDLATVRRQADRAADWQLVNPVTTGRFVHQHTPLYWTMGAFYNGLLDWGLANPGSCRFADHVRRVGAEVGWDRQRMDDLVLGHADTHCVCAAWLQLAAEDNVLGGRIDAAKECFDALRADKTEYTMEFIRKVPTSKMRWTWADALYMSPPSWVLLAGLTGDRGYLDHMAKEFHATTDKLFRDDRGLFYRDSTYLPGGVNWKGRDIFWGRGNGWVFGALAMILRDLPADHADRTWFVDLFRRMAEGVAACQQADGSWHPDLADPKTPDCPEMSGTSFFTYGLLWGMNNGLLDPVVYEPVARRAWAAICRAMDESGRLGWVQQVGSSPTAELQADYFEFYATGAYLCAAKELCTWIVRTSHPKCASVVVTGGKTYEPNREVRFKKGVVAPGERVWDVRYGREVTGVFTESGEFVFKVNVLAGQRREFLVLGEPLFTAGFMSALEVVAVYCPHAQSNPPLRPLVGILDSTSASDVSTEIALASNAGIGVFLYDATMDGLAEAEKAIDMGFLSAENSQGMKFAVCGRAVAASEESFVHFVERIGGRYFPHPEYWHRDGRPVLAVTDAADFVRTLGSDAARRAVKSAREKLRSAGVGEFELVARGVTCAQAADIQAVGFDVVQTETVPTDSGDPVRFEAALRESKSRVGASADGWVLLDAWNDYLHGRHLLPNLRLSDQMLRCVGRVFGRQPADAFVFGEKKANNPKAPNGKPTVIPMPTYENVKYGRHPRQGMDVWIPKSDGKPMPIVLFIHGGGWVNGDRLNNGILPCLETCQQRGVAFATVSYRLLPDGRRDGFDPPVRACLDDAVAAIRLVQARAREWNVDPQRIGLTGGSAGACSSLYAALLDDCALGVRAVFTHRPQTSLDPQEMREWIPNIKYGHSAFGYKTFDDWLAHREDCLPWIARFSPIALLRACTPSKAPLFLYYAMPDPPRGKLPKDPTHAGMFCTKFREACEAKGVSCRPGGYEDLAFALTQKRQ